MFVQVTRGLTRKQGDFSGVGLDKRIQAATRRGQTRTVWWPDGPAAGLSMWMRVNPSDNSNSNHTSTITKNFDKTSINWS